MSAYDPIARLYDPWSSSVIEDISFYVEEALAAGGGPVVELGVGTGRIAIPTAMAGVHVIGVDSSAEMLAVCQERANEAGIADRLDLRLGDLRKPPVDELVSLVTCPFRAYLHLATDEERLEALHAPTPVAARGTPRLRRLRTLPRGHRRDARPSGSSASPESTSARTGTPQRRR